MNDASATILRFISRLQRLEALPRTGWVVSGVPRPESVAAHCYEVALIALWIGESIPDRVDVERLLRIALLHDIGEALTSDIPRPVKDLLGRESFARAEAAAASVVLGDAPARWETAVEEYQAAESLEARIVKGADRIQMLARALAYEAQGVGDLRRFWEHDHPDYGIEFVRHVLAHLQAMHASGEWYAADFD